MNNDTLLLGIDIGWSEKQRSCAIAASDPKLKIAWPERTEYYGSFDLACCRFKLSELIDFLLSIQHKIQGYDEVIIVLDGPLGPQCKPTSNRPVDSMFRRGEFRNRMQPADLDNDTGRIYVDATYRVAECFTESLHPWVGGSIDSPLVIAETNPTVGLALMNPKYEVAQLPSRKRPLLPPKSRSDERAIRAKSDFYWRAGANSLCGVLLASSLVEDERNHENVAGLYCLAVASAICSDAAVSFGETETGVYVFPGGVDSDWHADLHSLGAITGKLELPICAPQRFEPGTWLRSSTVETEKELSSGVDDPSMDANMEDSQTGDDIEMMVLCDNGSVWQKHNDWLEGVEGPVRCRCTVSDTSFELKRGGGEGQWTLAPSALSLARIHGFDRPHLSLEHSLTIEVEILEMRLGDDVMILAIDLDSLAAKLPRLLSAWTLSWPEKVIAITCRSDREAVYDELERHDIRTDDIVFVESMTAKAKEIANRDVSMYVVDQPEMLEAVPENINVLMLRGKANQDFGD